MVTCFFIFVFCSDYTFLQESEKEAFWMEERKKSRPACFISEMELRQLEKLQQEHVQRMSTSSDGTSILGQVPIFLLFHLHLIVWIDRKNRLGPIS